MSHFINHLQKCLRFFVIRGSVLGGIMLIIQSWSQFTWAFKTDFNQPGYFSFSPSDSSLGKSKIRSASIFIQKPNSSNLPPKDESLVNPESVPSLGSQKTSEHEESTKGQNDCQDHLAINSTQSRSRKATAWPNLKITSVIIKDENDDGVLSAYEKAEIIFAIENTGKAYAYKVYPKVIPTGILKYLKIETVDDILHTEGVNYLSSFAPDTTLQLRLGIEALNNIGIFKANMVFVIKECNESNNTSPFLIEFPTDTFRMPALFFDSLNLANSSDNFIGKGKPFTVSSKISNKNNGQAWGIRSDLIFRENDKQYISFLNDTVEKAGQTYIGPQESRILTRKMLVSNDYSLDSLTFDFCIFHKTSRAPLCRSLTIHVREGVTPDISSSMTRIVENQQTISVDSSQLTDVQDLLTINPLISTSTPAENSMDTLVTSGNPRISPDTLISPAPVLRQIKYSEVDTGIPLREGGVKTSSYALIIGNEDYASYQSDVSSESNVHYAINDAKVFKDYCQNTFQVPTENIFYYTNATAGVMRQALNKISRIIEAEKGLANVFVYYSGHGLPSEITKKPYLIPVDISGSNVEEGISLDWFYEKLTKFPSQRVMVFLDACFSGGSRSDQLLALRGVRIVPQETDFHGNLVVLSSSSADQSSLVWKEKQHGLFTYYLLKKLKETGGDVEILELLDYLEREVNLQAIKKFNKVQTPKIGHSPTISTEILSKWKINE